MNIALDEQIKLLSKQLKIPTFAGYHNIQNHADPNSTFGELLLELMRTEYEQRQENNNRRRLKQANFPFTKTIDDWISAAMMVRYLICSSVNLPVAGSLMRRKTLS